MGQKLKFRCEKGHRQDSNESGQGLSVSICKNEGVCKCVFVCVYPRRKILYPPKGSHHPGHDTQARATSQSLQFHYPHVTQRTMYAVFAKIAFRVMPAKRKSVYFSSKICIRQTHN